MLLLLGDANFTDLHIPKRPTEDWQMRHRMPRALLKGKVASISFAPSVESTNAQRQSGTTKSRGNACSSICDPSTQADATNPRTIGGSRETGLGRPYEPPDSTWRTASNDHIRVAVVFSMLSATDSMPHDWSLSINQFCHICNDPSRFMRTSRDLQKHTEAPRLHLCPN